MPADAQAAANVRVDVTCMEDTGLLKFTQQFFQRGKSNTGYSYTCLHYKEVDNEDNNRIHFPPQLWCVIFKSQ